MRFWKPLFISAVALVLVLLSSITSITIWRHYHPEQREPFDVRSSWITDGNHDKPFVVVFVHGIFGDAKSFQNDDTDLTKLIANDPRFTSNTDVFSFRYYSPYFGEAANVVSLASQLRGYLEDNHVSEKQHIIFVAHSMGGIVVRLLLITDPKLVAKVPLMYFYATPTNGSALATNAQKISKNPQLRALLPLQGNDLLQTISDIWDGNEMLRRIPAHCGYETQPMSGGFFVVEQQSARALCNTQRDALPGNHISVVKPASRDDLRYSRFATALYDAEAKTPTATGTYYEYEFSQQGTPCIGVYRLKPDGNWREETISNQPCPTGSGFDFTQIPDAGDGVLLYDPARGVYIRLPAAGDGDASYAQSLSGPWGAIHKVRRVRAGS